MSGAAARPKIDSLGELETSVLDVLWGSADPLSVRDVGARLKRRPALAYTTVMTVLDRLHDKGFVRRDKSGRAFLYRPRVQREALMAEVDAYRAQLDRIAAMVAAGDAAALEAVFARASSARRAWGARCAKGSGGAADGPREP